MLASKMESQVSIEFLKEYFWKRHGSKLPKASDFDSDSETGSER